MNKRIFATTVITSILQNKSSLIKLIPQTFSDITQERDKSFTQELCYGVCRYYFQLYFFITQLLTKPIKTLDKEILALILIGLYQLEYMSTPDHAAIYETVEVCKLLKKSGFAPLVNAILRNFLRKKQTLLKKMIADPSAYFSHPHWMISLIKKSWPNHWQSILEANNKPPPMTLRVNRLKISRQDYLSLLHHSGLEAIEIPYLPSGIILKKPTTIKNLPGFSEGLVSIQDAAAQFAADLLDLKPGQLVLDACAAPGGKTLHILETEPNLNQLIAIDCDNHRIEMIKENLKREQLNAHIIHADASQLASWWNKKYFDRILLDAPCSAVGVIRRHPDIKLLRKLKDIKSLTQTQSRLLNSVWGILKPTGKLLYATCSMLPHENDQIVEKFLLTHQDAEIIRIPAKWGLMQKYGRQILPGQENMDGFYYALLVKH